MKIWLFLLLMTGTCMADNRKPNLDLESEKSECADHTHTKTAPNLSSASSSASNTPLPSTPGTPSSSASGEETPWWLSTDLVRVVMTAP